ncbi:MAG TPA: ABC transporter ATP-binding protein [Acidimicrobiales bacterium]
MTSSNPTVHTIPASVIFNEVAEEPGARKPDPILVAESITRRFGGLTAVDVDHLEVQRGAITALIGPNGAGKTTLFNLITGFDRADSGTWSFDGLRLEGLPAHKIARIGMVRTFQLTKALARLRVIDNMKLGATDQVGESFFRSLVMPLWRDQEAAITERAEELLGRFNLAHMRNEYAGELSGGQRKLLEMARALMSRPRLLMLDEPMAGVNPALAQTIMAHVQSLRDEGLTVVFVEHDMDVVREISDWVVVMAEGTLVSEGRHATIVSDQRVIDAYLGAHHTTPLERAEQDRQLADAAAALRAEAGVAEGDEGSGAGESGDDAGPGGGAAETTGVEQARTAAGEDAPT